MVLWLHLLLTAITVASITRFFVWVKKDWRERPACYRQREAMRMALQFIFSKGNIS